MRQVKAKFIVGLTATPSRKDGHHPIIFMQCGAIRFNLSAREAAERSPFRHLVLPRPTGFKMPPEITDLTIHDAYAALVTNEERNRQIARDILQAVREGRSPLVLTNRTDHIKLLASALSEAQHVLILKGRMGKKQRKAIAEQLASIPDGTPRVLLATGSYIGEGFDDSRLDTLSSRCRSRGAVRSSNTSGACTEFTKERRLSECSITWMHRFRCWAECMRSG